MPDTSSVARRSSPLTRRERTGIVALAVPNLEEPYFAELTTLLARGAEARGLSILIQQTEGDHQREIDVANGVGLPATDGLIHIPRSLTVGDLTRRTDPGPLVLLGEHIAVSPFTTCRSTTVAPPISPPPISLRRGAVVSPSSARGSRAPRMPRTSASRAIATRSRGSVSPTNRAHRLGRRLHLRGGGGGVAPSARDGDAVRRCGLLERLGRVRRAGRLARVRPRRPADVAVIGIDNVHAARFSVPALSSVAPDDEGIVEAAFTELERQMSARPGADVPVRHIVVDAAVVARASTAR